ncbi:MAG: penicillin-insensitive murein endopeptidase [Bdellovibrionia bacterium]
MSVLKKQLIILKIAASLLLAGCAGDGSGLGSNFEPINPIKEMESEDTYKGSEGYSAQRNNLTIISGVTKFENSKVKVNALEKLIEVEGVISIDSEIKQKFRVQLQGNLNQDGEAILRLKTNARTEVPSGLRLGAKAFCLDESQELLNCNVVVVDIFVRDGNTVYAHQIEARVKGSAANDKQDLNPELDGELGRYVGVQDVEEIEEIVSDKERPALPNPEKEKKSESNDDAKKEEPTDSKNAGDKKQSDPVETPKETEPKREAEPTPDGKEQPKPDSGKKDEPKAGSDKKEDGVSPSEPKKEKDSKGSTAKIPMAIGSPSEGSLLNAEDFTKVMNKNVLLLRTFRERHYGTKELHFVINKMANDTAELAGKKLVVGDLSAEKGGKIGSHKSHKNGLDVDLGYMIRGSTHFLDVTDGKKLANGLLLYQQWELFKRVVSTGYIDRIFLHRDLKKALCQLALNKKEVSIETKEGLAFETLRRLISDTEHNSHYHLRIKCSSQQKRCRQMIDPPRTMGCL